eukprot:TRINITY_DN595_c0_g1_i2.p1 TRINITY_DN595_c0_g1~~TRINITY_DN595_c0_g1_i2.p1  ORF type:complete len:375 (+),score=42.15 TRINITY_DN595_c0_g1_i2:34-1158(+)
MKVRKKDIVNRTGGVDTIDGRTVYGLDAESYLKIRAKEDPYFEKEVGQWIESVLGEKLNDLGDLHGCLKDGIILCRLLNKLKPGIIPKYNLPKKGQSLHPLMERENIGLFLMASKQFDISAEDMFSTTDLYARANMPQVCQMMAALSRSAGAQGSAAKSIGPRLSRRPTKIWEDVITEAQYIHTEDFSDDELQDQLIQTKRKLQESNLEVQRALISRDTMKHDLDIEKADKEQLQVEVQRLKDVLRDTRTSERRYMREAQNLKAEQEIVERRYLREVENLKLSKENALRDYQKIKKQIITFKSQTQKWRSEMSRVLQVKNFYKKFLVLLLLFFGIMYLYSQLVTNEMQDHVIAYIMGAIALGTERFNNLISNAL